MKFHLTQAAGRNLFTGYGEDYVSVNEQRYTHSVLVSPEGEVRRWDVVAFETLTADDVGALVALRPEILVLGTGEALRFPPAHVLKPLAGTGIGYEVMDTKAACRTYNILMSEGRRVVAAVVVSGSS